MSSLEALIYIVPLAIFAILYLIFNKRPSNTEATDFNNASDNPNAKMFDRPVITIGANHVLLDENMTLLPENRQALEKLAKKSIIFVIVNVSGMEEADHLLEPLSKEFENILDPERILFSQVNVGRASMARQLESNVHIDADPEVLLLTKIFMPSLLVSTVISTPPAGIPRYLSFSALVDDSNSVLAKRISK